jgi:putative Holliday junction resolvase
VMRHLALDVGDRRIGVAVSDECGLLASPLTVIRRASKIDDYAVISRLILEHRAGILVVGHPLNADGSAGPQAQRIERYAAALERALRSQDLNLPIVLWDEHSSTLRAQQAMISAGRKAKDRRTRIDAVAAAVILQDYMEAKRPVSSSEAEEVAC